MPRARPDESVLANFRQVLPRRVHRYFSRGRRLVKHRAPDERLHRFRIRTKRLRYTLELYAEHFPTVLQSSLKYFQHIQEQLGKLQDQRMLGAWLAQHKSESPAGKSAVETVLRTVAGKRKELRKAFFRGWKHLEKSSLEDHLVERIKRAAGRRVPSEARPATPWRRGRIRPAAR